MSAVRLGPWVEQEAMRKKNPKTINCGMGKRILERELNCLWLNNTGPPSCLH
jgi:hypothetical protein